MWMWGPGKEESRKQGSWDLIQVHLSPEFSAFSAAIIRLDTHYESHISPVMRILKSDQGQES